MGLAADAGAEPEGTGGRVVAVQRVGVSVDRPDHAPGNNWWARAGSRAAAPGDGERWSRRELERLDPLRAGDVDKGIGVSDAAKHLVALRPSGVVRADRRVADRTVEGFGTNMVGVAGQAAGVEQVSPSVLAGLENDVAAGTDDLRSERSDIGVAAVERGPVFCCPGVDVSQRRIEFEDGLPAVVVRGVPAVTGGDVDIAGGV